MITLNRLVEREFGYMNWKDWLKWPLMATAGVLPAYMLVATFIGGALMVPVTLLILGNSLLTGGDVLWAQTVLDQWVFTPGIMEHLLPWCAVAIAIPFSVWFTKPMHPVAKAIGFAHERRAWLNGDMDYLR